MVYKQDLADPSNDGEYDIRLRCYYCDLSFSGDVNDYTHFKADCLFTCDECEEPLILVRKVVTYERL